MEGPTKSRALNEIREKIAKGDVVDAEIVSEQRAEITPVKAATEPSTDGTPASAQPPLWQKANRRDYPKLDRTEQSYIVGSYIDENPEKARELAGYWNDFTERNPEILKLEKFDAPNVKKWAKEKGVKPMPAFDRLSLHRDLAETIAADEKRAQEKAAAEAAAATKTTDTPPKEKTRRKPRQVTGEKIPLSRTTPTPADLEWHNDQPQPETPLDKEPSLTNREKALAGQEMRERKLIQKLIREGRQQIAIDELAQAGAMRIVGEEDYPEETSEQVPDSRKEWMKKLEETIAKINQGNYSDLEVPSTSPQANEETSPEPELARVDPESRRRIIQEIWNYKIRLQKEKLKLARLETNPNADPALRDKARAEVKQIEAEITLREKMAEEAEASTRIATETPSEQTVTTAEQGGRLSPEETRDAYLEYYDTRGEQNAEPAPTETKPDLMGVDPLEYYGYTKPKTEVSQEAVPKPEVEQAATPAAVAENTLTDSTPVVGEDIPHTEAVKRLAERSNELNAEAKRLGEREYSWIRSWGEKYNRLPMKWKVGIGLALGAGTALTTGPLFLAAVGGLGFQRVSGGLGMFVHFEDRLLATQSSESMSKRERQAMAALGAIGYSAAAAGAAFGISALARGWLGEHWPFGSGEGNGPRIGDSLPTGPEIPDVSVEATQGKGYEFMAKRLWEQLQERGLDPSTLAEGSDLQQLAQADENTINKVVHDLATKHQFYQPDGESVLIKPGSILGFNENGELQFGEPGGNEIVNASSDAKVTPPYNPETPTPTPEAAPGAYAGHTAILDTEGNAMGHEPLNVETAQEQTLEGSASEPSFESLRAEPHIYLDKHGDLIAQGGSKADLADMVTKYLSAPENADKVVYTPNASGDGRVEWHMVDGEVRYNETMPRKGFLYKMLGDRLQQPPEEGDLRKLIK